MAGAVLMLQAFAGERGAPGGGADQEAARARIGRRPDQVADALKAEHRVEGIERQHRRAVRAVTGGGGDPGGQRPGLVDAFFQDLTVLRFLVIEQFVVVLRFVQLAERGIDADLAK